MVEETDFPARGNHFFVHFSGTPVSFLRLVEKYFSTKSFIPADFLASGNRFHLLKVFFSVETVTKNNGSQYLKKDHILTIENQFLG